MIWIIILETSASLFSLGVIFTLDSANETTRTKEMKVLMFGWEFPPHISGGLGIACHGLTKSLTHTGTEILFVVPRAHGDEEVNLINASDVLIKESDKTVLTTAEPSLLTQTGMKIISIASGIKPYSFGDEHEFFAIEEWNYEIPLENTARESKSVTTAKKYKFTGTYGAQLLEEVASYSLVAGALARHHVFDVIHAHDWLTYKAGIAAKEISGKPLVVHVHATEFDRSAQIDPSVFSIEKEGMEKADRIVAVSEWTKKILIEKYQIEENKVSVVHNGITNKKVARKGTIRRPDQVVTFLGRITFQKGPQYFIEAARKVLLRLPDVHFVMAGSGDLLPAMMELVAKLRLSSRFHFTGFMKGQQLDQIWSGSDLYVMPSVSEPFGIAPLEAIQAGVPIIISKQSGVSEVMPHALKVDFWNVDNLANAIYLVLIHPCLSNTLRKKSRRTLKKITWNKAAKKINTIYNELASSN